MDEIDTTRPKQAWVITLLIVVAIFVGGMGTLVAAIVRLGTLV